MYKQTERHRHRVMLRFLRREVSKQDNDDHDKTKSSAVAERPRDASSHRIFR